MMSGRTRAAICSSQSPARSTSSQGSSIHSSRYALSNKRTFLRPTTCSYCSRLRRSPMLAKAISIPYGSRARASSSAYVQTPPIESTVMRILRGNTLEVCVLINRIDGRRDLDDPFNFTVKRGISRQAACPFHCRAPKPLVRRRGQYFATRRVKAFGNEIVERAVHVAHARAAFCSVKGRFDDSVASGVQMPRATQVNRSAAGEIESRRSVVVANASELVNPFAVVQQSTRHANNRLIEHPKRRVHQMNPKNDDATTTRVYPIIEPGLLRAIRIMEDKIYSEDFAELILPNELPNASQRFRVAIREIDAEEAIGGARHVDYF